MTTTPLRAITFVFRGTLVDAGHDYSERRIAYLARCLGSTSVDACAHAYHESAAVASGVTAAGLALPTAAVLSLTLDVLGATLSPEHFCRVVTYWEEVILEDPPPPLPGIPETLAQVQDLGLAVALIYDAGMSPGRSLRRVLSAATLLRYFDRVTSPFAARWRRLGCALTRRSTSATSPRRTSRGRGHWACEPLSSSRTATAATARHAPTCSSSSVPTCPSVSQSGCSAVARLPASQ